MDTTAEVKTIKQALLWLRVHHGIRLGSAGLRAHLSDRGKQNAVEPVLVGKFEQSAVMPTGYWTVTLADLQAWAVQYASRRKTTTGYLNASRK